MLREHSENVLTLITIYKLFHIFYVISYYVIIDVLALDLPKF